MIPTARRVSPTKKKSLIGLLPESAKSKVVVIPLNKQSVFLQVLHPILDNLPPAVKTLVLCKKGESKKIFPKQHAKKKIIEAGFASQLWVRDFFPEIVFLPNGSIQLVQFKYFRSGMEGIGTKTSKILGLPLIKSKLIIEGGNLMADEWGNLFATTKILFKNQPIKKSAIENELKHLLFVQKIHWLPCLPGDTSGHVDNFLLYVGHNRFLVSQYPKGNHKNKPLGRIARKLTTLGHKVFRVPSPPWGKNFVHSYTNALLVNNKAFIPKFSYLDGPRARKAYDRKAQAIYKSLGFDPIPIPSHYLVAQKGLIHCITKKIPFGLPG